MDILLISGLLTDPTIVPLALPALAAQLRSEGLTVETWDLSIACFDTLTSKPFLSDAIACIDRQQTHNKEPVQKDLHRAISIALVLAPLVIDRLEDAKATFRDKERFYGTAAIKAHNTSCRQFRQFSTQPFFLRKLTSSAMTSASANRCTHPRTPHRPRQQSVFSLF